MDGSEHSAKIQLNAALSNTVVRSNKLTGGVNYVGVLFFVVIAIPQRLSTMDCCKNSLIARRI